jgi:hypothetical protein
MPPLTPSTTPVPDTVAIPGVPVLHVPPLTASVIVTDEPTQTAEGPVIDPAPEGTLTVTGAETTQVPMV